MQLGEEHKEHKAIAGELVQLSVVRINLGDGGAAFPSQWLAEKSWRAKSCSHHHHHRRGRRSYHLIPK